MPLSENEIQRKIILIGERIEKGRTNPTYRTLCLVADALEISVVKLIDLKA